MIPNDELMPAIKKRGLSWNAFAAQNMLLQAAKVLGCNIDKRENWPVLLDKAEELWKVRQAQDFEKKIDRRFEVADCHGAIH